nr:CoA-binding protein [Bacteroidota bacterium]
MQDRKKTLVIGASPNPVRYSNAAVKELVRFNCPVEALGLRKNSIENIEIKTGFPKLDDVHTITMYVGPKNQSRYYNYILDEIKPKRIIFNPGTENAELLNMAVERGVEVVEDCTLMMLAHGSF